jgi:hypothetical protein
VTRDEMQGALTELGAELEEAGVQAKLWLVGGAVIVLAFQSRDSSDDLDAAVHPSDEVLEVARRVGMRRGLETDWLSDAAKIYVPLAIEPDWQLLGQYGSLDVLTADEQTMLAMKLRASRGRRDQVDIDWLVARCGFSRESEVVGLYERYFPEDPLPKRAVPLIRPVGEK